jgi:hypothetical protein
MTNSDVGWKLHREIGLAIGHEVHACRNRRNHLLACEIFQRGKFIGNGAAGNATRWGKAQAALPRSGHMHFYAAGAAESAHSTEDTNIPSYLLQVENKNLVRLHGTKVNGLGETNTPKSFPPE